MGHSLPTPALIDYISVPEIEINCLFYLVTWYNTDTVLLYSEKEKATWAAKEIAVVLLWCL